MATSCPVCDVIKHRKHISAIMPLLKQVDLVRTVYETTKVSLERLDLHRDVGVAESTYEVTSCL
jgi:hypothetical protein